MTQQTSHDDATLGTSLTTLSASAGGLRESVRSLNRAMDDLQVSTERWSDRQRAASESLARAADSLRPASGTASSSGFAPADD